MLLSGMNDAQEVNRLFDEIGLKEACIGAKKALIKINLARPPVKNHPRTSVELIKYVVEYMARYDVKCTLAEGADGYLEYNLREIGLSEFLDTYNVDVLDLDSEEVEKITVDEDTHFIPRCLLDYDIRIAIPMVSKRENSIYSNNVKLFVGAVPRKFYQIGKTVTWRPRLHLNLHKSVASLFMAMEMYAPFDFYVNGGLAMDEHKGEFHIPEVFVGNDALELDEHVRKKYFDIEMPKYLETLLEARK